MGFRMIKALAPVSLEIRRLDRIRRELLVVRHAGESKASFLLESNISIQLPSNCLGSEARWSFDHARVR